MTIEEIEKLAEDQENKKLRFPKTLKGEIREKVTMAHEQFVIIVDDVLGGINRNHNEKNADDLKTNNKIGRDFINSMYGEYKMKKNGISKIKPYDNLVGSYSFKSELGEGIFFDAHKLFPENKYPKFIKQNYCFSNSHLYVLQTKLEATVLSGIAFMGKPFLHSVILVGGNIIDFNYHLVISKDLYFALTHFEVLAELDSKQLLENEKLIRKIKGVQSHVFNYAFEEVIENAKQKYVGTGVDD